MTKKTAAPPPTPAWRDCTTYRRDQKDRKPTSFRISLGRLELAITFDHIYYRGQWVMHFASTMNAHPLDAVTEAEAKTKALKIARDILTTSLNRAEKALAAEEDWPGPRPEGC